MEALAQEVARHLLPLGAVAKRMFGGTGFMRNGNLVGGTMKQRLILRVGPQPPALAMGARQAIMGARAMTGWVEVDADAIVAEGLTRWLDLALAFNATLPPGAAKVRRKTS